MALAPRTRSRGQHTRVAAPDEIHPNRGGPAILERIRQTTANQLDGDIDRSLQTGRPANPAARPDLDMAEEGIGNRMTALSEDPAFQKEYKMRLMHRMLVRQLPMDLIAQALGCSVRNAYYLREALFAQLREEASNKDLPTYVGMTDGFYNDVIGMCMRMASSTKASDVRKLGALQVALQAQRDRQHFYDLVGFHDVLKVTPVSGMFDSATDQAKKLSSMAENILEAFNDGLADDPPASAPTRTRSRDPFEDRSEAQEQQVIRTRIL